MRSFIGIQMQFLNRDYRSIRRPSCKYLPKPTSRTEQCIGIVFKYPTRKSDCYHDRN